MNRRGFVLAELLVATLVCAVMAVLIGRLMAESAWRLRDRSEHMAMEQALRVSLAAGRSLLEPLGFDSTTGADLGVPGGAGFRSRITRGTGVACDVYPDRIVARRGTDWWWATRNLVPGRDSLLAATVSGPDRWVAAPLIGAPLAGSCSDGSAGLVLPTVLSAPDLAALGGGSPLLGFEWVELRLYSSSGTSWLGIRQLATGEAIQPLAGPLDGSAGFSWYDGAGHLTLTPDEAVSAGFRLQGNTERAGGVGVARLPRAASDSGVVLVGLRGRP